MGFFATLFGLLVKPLSTLAKLEKRDLSLGTEMAAGFLTMVSFMGSFLAGLLLIGGALASPDPALGGLGVISGLLTISLFMVFGVVGAFLGAIWYHLWLTLFGVRGFRRTLTLYFHTRAPALLQILFFLPQSAGLALWIILSLWTLLLLIHGIRIFHGLPLRSAATVVALAFIVNIAATAVSIGGIRPAILLFPQVSPLTADFLFPTPATPPAPPPTLPPLIPG